MQLKFSERFDQIEVKENEKKSPVGNQFLVHDFHEQINILKHFGNY